MAYSRYRLRGRLLEVLDQIPQKIEVQKVPQFVQTIRELRDLHRYFSDNPFEYVAQATKEEHRDLAQIFARLLDLAQGALNQAILAFRTGDVEFAISDDILRIKNQLAERAGGLSATSMYLSKASRQGDLDTEDSSGQRDGQ